MRTATYDVPPQEVSEDLDSHQNFQCFPRSDPDEGQCDSFCECHNVLQGELEKLQSSNNQSHHHQTIQSFFGTKVANAIRAVANVDDYSGSARLLAATTLR